MASEGDNFARLLRDPLAFADLVPLMGPALHGYLARRCPQRADDLLADVWLAAYASRGSFDPSRGTLRTWLFGIARHVLLGDLRRARLAARVVGLSDPPEDKWDAVDQRLDAAAVSATLRQSLADLPESERELLLLVAWEGLTPSEAAQVVGVPAGTARSRLHRARGAMRRAIASPESARPHAAPVVPSSSITQEVS